MNTSTSPLFITRLTITFLTVMVSFTPSYAQQKSESPVTISMDMQPVLQLQTTSNNQITFSFDQLNDYYAGVTLYGATVLKVNATVNWDLYAIGTSTGNVGPGFWDLQFGYGNTGTNASNRIPLSALELRQSTPNNYATTAAGVYADYSSAFPPVQSPSGSNSIYVDPSNTNAPPTTSHKYIAGHAGATGSGNDGVFGGSYLSAGVGASDFYYVIDYRIVPGLPAVFPMAFDANGLTPQNLEATNGAGVYAQPGVYTMNVQYFLVEDQ
jgi:hypothetical protein